MGICINNNYIQKYILCSKPSQENNFIVINLDKNIKKKNKENKEKIEHNENEKNNLNKKENEPITKNVLQQNNNNIIIYKLQTKFKPILLNGIDKNDDNINKRKTVNINYNRTKGNKYNATNDNCEKLIHFTSYVNNISATTNSILK